MNTSQNDPLCHARLATIPAVASALSVSMRHIYRMMDKGELPTVKFGPHATRIPVDAVEQFIKSRMSRKGDC